MARLLRLALLVDPLTVRMKGGEHTAELARALRIRGHELRAFGAPPDLVPTSTEEHEGARGVIGFAPDAVIAYDALSPAAWLGARAARKLRVPLVLVEAGVFARGSILERSLWRIGHSLWGAYVRRSTARLVALDSVARDQAVQDGFAMSRCRVILHGVDLDRFRPGLSCRLIARHRIVGRVMSCASPLDARSGLDTLISAFARTLGQRNDWSLVVAGHGPQRPRLRAAADRLGIGAHVHFVEEASPEELPGLFSASTVVVQPTLDANKSPLALLQAMACGVPVLASDLPRFADVVRETQSGLLAAPGDLASWSSALSNLALAPDARSRWGDNGLRVAEERFSWLQVAGAFERTILEARGEDDDRGAALPLAS